MVIPSRAFLPEATIKEILGDTVPYFEGNLPEDLIRELNIKTKLTVDILINTLRSFSSDNERAYNIVNGYDIKNLNYKVILFRK